MDYTGFVAADVLVTVVETPEFVARAKELLTEDERETLIAYLAANPAAGDLMQGTGGVRKLRWRLEGRGKRGGARVIYFYSSTDIPLFALTVFAKSERADLTQQDRNELRRLTRLLIDTYRRPKR